MNAVVEPQVLTLIEQPEPAQQPLAVQQQVPTTVEHVLTLAVQKGATVEQMERMMVVAERMQAHRVEQEKRDAEKAYNEAFAAFRAEAVEIVKRKRVHFTSQKGTTDYKHAELSDVIEAVTPALSRHGLSHSWSPKQEKDWLWITCTLKHKAGHSESATLGGAADTSGNKNPIQALASTKTMLERQTLKAVCGVAEKGEDDDGAGAKRKGKDIAALLADLRATTTDSAAHAHWIANREALAGDPAYNEFKAAVIAHRDTLKGAKQ